ncbi:MAG: outer membrane protein assembly factor BamD [Kiritimatiellae bacterium]|nr:outer membrane protein assembly factor BamD [Kiritimatiellia bacterium]
MKNLNQNNDGDAHSAFVHAYRGLLFFLKKQSVFLYLALFLAAFILAGFVFYTLKTSRGNEQAARLLGVAQTSKQFEDLARQYPRSPAAPAALLALASSCFSSGDYAAADSRYVEFIEKYPRHPMLTAAEMGKVMCAEGRGEMEKALVGFNAFLLAHPAHFLAPQAFFGKARCLQATGKLNEARVIYEDFIAAHPENKWRPNAEAALQALDRQIQERQSQSAGQ